MKSIYILNPRAPKKAKICQIYPPSSQSGSLHFVLHLYWFVIYQSEDLDFRISKIGTKCEKNWKEQKKEPKGTKKSQNYNFLPKNEKVSTSVSHWSSLWYIKSKILPWRICRLWKDSTFLFRSQKKPKYVKFGLLIFQFFL